MVYDTTQPTNTTKLRNVGVVIRPNWLAIEDGDSTFKPKAVNLNNRTPLGVPNDPAAIANSYIIYSKQDTSGNVQLWGIDPASRVTQLSVSISPLKAANGYTWLAGGMLLQWGQTGAIGSGANAGIAFPTAFSASAYSVQITGRHNGSEVVSGNIAAIGAANFTLRNTSVSARDFYWVAIGPKV